MFGMEVNWCVCVPLGSIIYSKVYLCLIWRSTVCVFERCMCV